MAAITTAGLALTLTALALPVFTYQPQWRGSRSLFELLDAAVWPVVVLLVAEVALVLWAWLGRGRWGWRVLTTLVSPLLPWLLLSTIADFVIVWDGIDQQGNPTGGTITMVPAIGAWTVVAGGVLHLVAVLVSVLFWLRDRAEQ